MGVDPAIASGSSHQGARDYQEDRFDVVELKPGGRSLLLIVCDGMGGHAHGAEAAQSAVDAFVRNMRGEADPLPARRLRRSLDRANEAVARYARSDPRMKGMGCTLSAILVEDGRAHWISVGDSPIWLIRGGKIERLNEDHSMGGYYQALIDKREMTRDEARQRGGFNQLRSAVMGDAIEMIDSNDDDGLNLKPADAIVVASDGLLTLPEADIADQVRSRDAGQAAQRLVDEVIARGRPRQDNVTAICYLHGRTPRPRSDKGSSTGEGLPDRRESVLLWLVLAVIAIALTTLVLVAFYPEILPPSGPPSPSGAAAGEALSDR